VPTAKHKEMALAIQMRSQGASIKEIADFLKVSKGSVSPWVAHIVLNKQQISNLRGRKLRGAHAGRLAAAATNKEKYQKSRQASRSMGFSEATGYPLHVAGCMLYWAEGSKSMNSAVMSNTDPILLRKFVEFLIHLGVSLNRIKVSCSVHDTPGNASHSQCKIFWAKNLGVSEDVVKVFRATDVRGLVARKSHYPHGVGRVAIHDVSIVQRIYGGIERYAGEEMVFGRKYMD
jgi:hypothetical protein